MAHHSTFLSKSSSVPLQCLAVIAATFGGLFLENRASGDQIRATVAPRVTDGTNRQDQNTLFSQRESTDLTRTLRAQQEQINRQAAQLERFQRELDFERLHLVNEVTRPVALPTPFHSPPEEELLTRGYVWKEGEKTVYSGPDPQVMLSATFLDTHCFRPVESDSANRPVVGLAFEPVEGRTLPDITGVLWMDEATAELSHLEYSYVRMENEELDNVGGGRAEFQQLENGAWIVRRWWITMPQVHTHGGIFGFFSREEVVGFEDTGGETLVASGRDGRNLLPRGRESVAGVVWDSLTGGPLGGATVYLSGSSHVAQSNADGTFLLQGLHPGEYLATFRHRFYAVFQEVQKYPANLRFVTDHDSVAQATKYYILPSHNRLKQPPDILHYYHNRQGFQTVSDRFGIIEILQYNPLKMTQFGYHLLQIRL